MKAIYKFYWDCGRQGYLSGIFVADKNEVENAIGQRLYFGEVLGKHSEVYGELEASDLEMVSDSPSDIEVFERLDLTSGRNPLNYLPEEEDED
jgi:hypothetical protein